MLDVYSMPIGFGINAVKDKRIKGINEKETNMEKTVSILQSIGDFIAFSDHRLIHIHKWYQGKGDS